MCECEPGFKEVFLHTGQLSRCVPVPVLDIPPWEDKKGDVKTIRAIDTPSPTPVLPGLPGRTWYLQPYGPGQTGSAAAVVVVVVVAAVTPLTAARPSPQTGS